ncbi:MAG: acetyl-CoA carboxylase carboxyl transferase subunit alpha [Bacilli bacterium]
MNKQDYAWEKVQLARNPKRPTSQVLIKTLFSDFIELHGDRLFGDDGAIIGGIATFLGKPITIIGEEKGDTTEHKIARNFGMPSPEGYRKAKRLIEQAEKFSRPILLIVDTPGAFPGIGAEERGQAGAIAANIQLLMRVKTVVFVVVLGEGGSGGALALGVGDYVMMFENSIFSILSPEGFASIVYKDSSKAKEAASIMRLTASDLQDLGVIDEILLEGEGLHQNYEVGFKAFQNRLQTLLLEFGHYSLDALIEKRYQKYRKMGLYLEGNHE